MERDIVSQIEAWNIDLMMSKVVTRETKCSGCGGDVYTVYDESRTYSLFTVCSCGVMPKKWTR